MSPPAAIAANASFGAVEGESITSGSGGLPSRPRTRSRVP
jgi:hypothetical protein